MGKEASLDIAFPLIAKWEGLHKKLPNGLYGPYLCPALVWTIGYGSTRLEDGSRVAENTAPITAEYAEFLLRHEMEGCQNSALVLSPNLSLYPARLAAITSFIYNLGSGNYRISTLRAKINAGEFLEASKQIKRWVWAGGRKLPGLIARRNEEAELLWPSQT